MGTNLESEFLIRILKACYRNVLSVYRYGNEPGVRVSDTYSEVEQTCLLQEYDENGGKETAVDTRTIQYDS